MVEYLGIISRPQGTDGTMLITDTVGLQVTLDSNSIVSIGFAKGHVREYRVAEWKATEQRSVLRLQGVGNREEAERLVDQAVYVNSADVVRSSSETYSIGDIEGCAAVNAEGQTLGIVTDVLLLPANDVWVVTTPAGKEIPVPVIDGVVLNVDVANKQVTVALLEGLEDVNDNSNNPEIDE